MVWVLCELALRPHYQNEICDEIKCLSEDGSTNLTNEGLKRAVVTDSFIREVMRTKGDTFSTVRMAVKDVQLGKYIIPKGLFTLLFRKKTLILFNTGYTVHPNAALAHNNPSEVGENADEFDGRRWLKKGKPAAMTGISHLAFGLGRWACPGRFFAVAGKPSTLYFRSKLC